MAGMTQNLAAMWFNAAPDDHGHGLAAIFQARGSLNCHHPSFVGIKAPDLKEDQPLWIALLRDLAQELGFVFWDWFQEAAWDAVGDNQRVDAPTPEPVFHIATDGEYRGAVVQSAPVDAMQGHQAIDIPDHQHPMPQVVPVEQIGDAAHDLCGVPVFAHNDDELSLADSRFNDLLIDMRGHTLIIIVDFGFFAVVDAAQIVFADPLAPALQDEFATHALLDSRFGGVAHKNQVGRITKPGQCLGEFGDARPQSACGRVDIWPLKAERDKDSILWRNCQSITTITHSFRLVPLC